MYLSEGQFDRMIPVHLIAQIRTIWKSCPECQYEFIFHRSRI